MPKRLAADLARVRKDGIAISRGEVFVGAIAIAAPYFDHAHRVVGSVGVFGPQARLDGLWVTKTTASVTISAVQLSTALGKSRRLDRGNALLRIGIRSRNDASATRLPRKPHATLYSTEPTFEVELI